MQSCRLYHDLLIYASIAVAVPVAAKEVARCRCLSPAWGTVFRGACAPLHWTPGHKNSSGRPHGPYRYLRLRSSKLVLGGPAQERSRPTKELKEQVVTLV